jgi:outer membrane lipase/esterase
MRRRGMQAAAVVAAWLAAATPAMAQGLNDVVAALVSNQCAALGGPSGTYGPQLAAICSAGPPSTGSAGGGTTTLETRASQFDEERRLSRRLRERREQAASADSALGGGFSLFATAEYQNLNKDNTRFETGFRQDTAGLTLGGDYAFGRLAVLGAAVDYAHEFGDYNGAGGYDNNKYGVFLYGSLTPLPRLFVDATVGYRRLDFSFDRRVTLKMLPAIVVKGPTSADTDGNEFRTGVNAGYDFVAGRFTFGPRVGVNYRYDEMDSFHESGNTGLELAYDRQHQDSLTTVAGLFGSMAISTGIGVFVPQVTADYVHEFLNDQRDVRFRLLQDLLNRKFTFQTDPPDRDYVIVGVGTVLVLPGGLAPFINYRELLGYKDRTSHTVTAGLRFSF